MDKQFKLEVWKKQKSKKAPQWQCHKCGNFFSGRAIPKHKETCKGTLYETTKAY